MKQNVLYAESSQEKKKDVFMNKDNEYLGNYKLNTYYVKSTEKVEFHTMVTESEEEIQVSPKIKLTIQASITTNGNPKKLTIKKIKLSQGEWVTDGEVKFTTIEDIDFLKNFLSILTSLNLPVGNNNKITFDSSVDINSLKTLLDSTQKDTLVNIIQNNPNIHEDIIALHHRKNQLVEFERMLDNTEVTEPQWQKFFEKNQWIFGYGLQYVFLDSLPNNKLETTAVGSSYDRYGKRIDALMLTKAEISNYVLIEIKTPQTPLLKEGKAYRSGCYVPSEDLSGAIMQVQKTTYEFVRSKTEPRDNIKNKDGSNSSEYVYKVQPKCFVVIGRLNEIVNHEDKIKSFELYRNSLNNPEVITFDELFYRAKSIVEILCNKESF